jgi:hypothetical protein
VKRELLFARVPGERGQIGIGAPAIAQMPLEPAVVDELWDCLTSTDELDVTFGLFFLDELLRRAEFMNILQGRAGEFAQRLKELVTGTSTKLQADAIAPFVSFQEFHADFTSIMKGLLKSSDVVVRSAALDAAHLFLKRKDLKLLLAFREDKQADETERMGGPLRYTMRDRALEQAERIAGRSFANGDCFEMRDGEKVSWRSWSSFLNWLG